ncbi:unnamed protein product, partial [Linum tenue]
LTLTIDKPPSITNTSTDDEKTIFKAWEKSDRLSIMFLRMIIACNIKTSLPVPTTANKYLKSIEERFKNANISLAEKLMVDLKTMNLMAHARCMIIVLR